MEVRLWQQGTYIVLAIGHNTTYLCLSRNRPPGRVSLGVGKLDVMISPVCGGYLIPFDIVYLPLTVVSRTTIKDC
jgi:hypothetical protein